MNRILFLSTLFFALQAAPDKPIPGEAHRGSLKTFIAGYATCCFVGTYAYLYHQKPHLAKEQLFLQAFGYTGVGFSIAAASYLALLLWAESGLLQDKSERLLTRQPQ